MHISRHDRVYQTLANIFLIILVVVIILPFLLLFISSITEEGTLVRDGYTLSEGIKPGSIQIYFCQQQ